MLWSVGTIARPLARAWASLSVAALGMTALMCVRLPAPSSRSVPVSLDCRTTDRVLTLTARTARHGASHIDRWTATPSLALTAKTVLDGTDPRQDWYVSTARVLKRALANDTTYTFSYSIVMRAGEDTWAGSGSVAITIGPCCTPPAPPAEDGNTT